MFILLLIAYTATLFGQSGLETQVQEDLLKINLPVHPWILHSETYAVPVLDVAIVGGGMAGMTAAFALIKEGITNIQVFDENPQDLEGPWMKYARMKALRSHKEEMGLALGIPSLTFHSWYEAKYGKEQWNNLAAVPTPLWSKYLSWFRRTLNLPVENNCALVKLIPSNNLLELRFSCDGSPLTIFARKVVLATGREGSGGCEVPCCLQDIPKRLYAHTAEMIDPQFFSQKRVIIIGAGASAFDAAGVALENGAKSVDMLVRRPSVLCFSKNSKLANPGFDHGFYHLGDEMKCHFFAEAFKGGIDPSVSAVERIKGFKNLYVHCCTSVEQVIENEKEVIVQTNKGNFHADFIVCGTGYGINLSQRSELEAFRPAIMLWEKHVPKELLDEVPMLGSFPYLGRSFEFTESEPGQAPYLKNIYCFNYGAFLSHGLLTGFVSGISLGATRLAQGIAADFFISESELYLNEVKNWHTPNFNLEDYPQLINKQ